MRHSPKVMRSIFGQMDSDNANIRSIAFEKARTTLANEGVTFTHLLEAHERCAAIDGAAARTATATTRPPPMDAARPHPAPPPPPPNPPPGSRPARPSHERVGEPAGDGPDFSGRVDGDPHTRANGLARTLHGRRIWFFTVRSEGRRIIRDKAPPRDTLGVLRILKDRIIGEGVFGSRHSMTPSFEAENVLYEPFVVTGEKPEWIRQMHRLSTTGDEILW